MNQTDYGRQGDDYIVSPEQKALYQEHGYITLRNVLTGEELNDIEQEFDHFISGSVPDMGRDFCDMSGPYDRKFEDFALVNAMLPTKYKPALQGNIYEKLSASIAKQLIGDDATLDYDQFLAKRPARPDAKFTLHQDLGYWPTGTPDTITATCSLAVDDANSENGCLYVIPGSHQQGLRVHKPVHGKDRESSHILGVALLDGEALVELPLNKGDITVHNELILHGSGGNRSETSWRRTYITAFRSKACVEFERKIGFTHSHNDKVNWATHLGALK